MRTFFENHPKILLVLLWAALTLPTLGIAPLFDYDETIYAQTALDMMHKGEWIIPTANGMQFFEKPPFTYYMMDAAFAAFGENAFAARLPSALFTLFTVLLLFHFGWRLHSREFGFAAALTYFSMFEVGFLAHAAILDPVLNFFIAGTLLFYAVWREFGNHRDAFWCALMMGAAVGIKGPVGAVIPLMVIGVDTLWRRDLVRTLQSIPWATVMPLFLIAALPWYLLILLVNGPGFLYEFIWVHNIERALKPMQGHGGGWHYYFVVFAVSVLPWLALLPRSVSEWWERRSDDQVLPTLARLGIIWTLLVLLLFTFAQTKLPHYISSIYPGVALLLAAAIVLRQRRVLASRVSHWVTFLLLAPLAILLILFPWAYEYVGQFVKHPRALAIVNQPIEPPLWIAGLGVLLLAALVWLVAGRNRPGGLLLRFAVLGFALQLSVIGGVGVFAGNLVQAPQMRIAEELRKLPPDMPVYSYMLNMPSISFYAGRSYQIKTEPGMPSSKVPYALILRTEEKANLPRLKRYKPQVEQGGFMLYLIKPARRRVS